MKLFKDLTPGDRIFWRGADGDEAQVIRRIIEVSTRETSQAFIEWTTGGETHRAWLRWEPDAEVDESEVP